jgi:hypothetical protein
MVWVKISVWRDSTGQQQLLVQKHLLSMSYTNLFSTDPAASIFGTGVFHLPTVPTNGYWPHDHLAFASPLPLFLSPTNLKFSVQDCIEDSLKNFKITEYTEMAIWRLSHYQINTTLYS